MWAVLSILTEYFCMFTSLFVMQVRFNFVDRSVRRPSGMGVMNLGDFYETIHCLQLFNSVFINKVEGFSYVI